MSKIKLRLFIVLLTLFVLSQVSLLVLFAEKDKRLKKLERETSYYKSLTSDFSSYSLEVQKQIQDLRATNSQKMTDAKKQYEDLLSQQPGLVARSTRVTADASITNSTTTVAKVTSNNNSGTKTVTVTKPSSKPKTKTS